MNNAPWWEFWLARLLGEEYTGVDECDGVRYDLTGHVWRGHIYIHTVKTRVVDQAEFKRVLTKEIWP